MKKKYTITFHIDDGTDQDYVIESEDLQEAHKLADFMVQSITYVKGYSIQPGEKND